MEFGNYRIPVFSENPSDFQEWKLHFITGIGLRKLRHMLDPENPTKCPPSLDPTNRDRNYTSKWETEHGANYRKWKDDSEQIYHLLMASCGINISRSINEEIRNFDGVAAWNLLVSRYETKDNLRIIHYIRELTHIRYEENSDVDIYLNTVDKLIRLIRGATSQKTIPDSLKVGFIYAGLPDSMLDWIATRTSDDSNKIENVKKDLRKYVSSRQELIHKDTIETPGAFLTDKKHSHPSIPTKAPQNPPTNPKPKPFKPKTPKPRPNRPPKRFCNICKASTHNTNYHDTFMQNSKHSIHTISPYSEEDAYMLSVPDSVFLADNSTSNWTVDSGCTIHICMDKSKFTSLNTSDITSVQVADGRCIEVAGIGTITIHVMTEENSIIPIILHNVLYVPQLQRNLFSLKLFSENPPHLSHHGISITGKAAHLIIQDSKSTHRILLNTTGKFYILPTTKVSESTMVTNHISSSELWHYRLGHSSSVDLTHLTKCVTGLSVSGKFNHSECEPCLVGKMARSKFPDIPLSQHKVYNKLELIHSDICGPFLPTIGSGEQYIISFIDDATRLVRCYLMHHKSDALKYFKQFIADCGCPSQLISNIRNPSSIKELNRVGALRGDNGGEYTSNQFHQFCLNSGIRREFTCAYTPAQNGVAERFWRTLVGMIRSMLKHAQLPKSWWGRAALTAVYIRNRLLNSSNSSHPNQTPYELFFGVKPDLSMLRVFGCKVYVYNEDPKRTKLDDRSIPGYFAGYSTEVKGWKIWLPEKRKFIISRNVKFLESSFMESSLSDLNSNTAVDIPIPIPNTNPQNIPNISSSQPQLPPSTISQIIQPPIQLSPSPVTSSVQSPHSNQFQSHTGASSRRSARTIKSTKEKDFIYSVTNESQVEYALMLEEVGSGNIHEFSNTPTTYKQASQLPQWNQSMQEEYDAHIKNGTWKLVEFQPSMSLIGSKWVYKIKTNADGSISRYKSRLVAQGYTQVEGINFSDTFAPVARFVTLRSVIALAAMHCWNILQADVTTAYLHSPVEEELYMKQPPGFQQSGPDGKLLVCKLQKSIYGLKQAGRNWNQLLNKWFENHHFIRSQSDPCLYSFHSSSHIAIITIYVDDILITGNDSAFNQIILQEIGKSFSISLIGPTNWILGMHISYNDNSIKIDQSKYLQDILKRFDMVECRTYSAPAIAEEYRDRDSEVPTDSSLYKQLIGSLIYLSVITRPDISFAVGKLSKYMQQPTEPDMVAAFRVLRYLAGTQDRGITYSNTGDSNFVAYADADWAGDKTTAKSTSGYVITFAGAAISWQSKRQSVVAKSATEAEYISSSICGSEIIYLRQLFADMGFPQQIPTILYQDNRGAIRIQRDPISSKNTRHINVHFHFIRDHIKHNHIQTVYLPTSEMIADCLTKPVDKQILARSLPKLIGTSN
jgi:hypothetical protein